MVHCYQLGKGDNLVGGGGNSLIWPKWVCAALECKFFTVLIPKQGIQFHYLAS